MSNVQIILLILRLLKAIDAKDSTIVTDIVVPAIVDELDGTDEEKEEVGNFLGDLLKGLFGGD